MPGCCRQQRAGVTWSGRHQPAVLLKSGVPDCVPLVRILAFVPIDVPSLTDLGERCGRALMIGIPPIAGWRLMQGASEVPALARGRV